MIATYGFHFEQPWWLLGALLALPAVWLARRSLRTLGPIRRVLAMGLRAAVISLLAAMLARPTLTRTHETLTVLAVVDRSQSVPGGYWREPDANAGPDGPGSVIAWLRRALADKPAADRLAVIDVAERADVTRLPSTAADVPKRSLALRGLQSRLAAGVQLALAVAPPNSAVRILLISDGNETSGDLRAVARVAAANGIPIDVLPLRYRYQREVVFRRLVAPGRARSGQTVPVRFVLSSTHEADGQLMLTLNDRPVDLDPASDLVTAAVHLKPGTNVHTVSLPVGLAGVHDFEAQFIPHGERDDRLAENNTAATVTFVAGPGHVLVVASDDREAEGLLAALTAANIDARLTPPAAFPRTLTGLLDADAVVLVNTSNDLFTAGQQEMLVRYVADLGGGLVTVGGPNSYGAGGWIGSPVAKILPVDLDPPQVKQMPRGALVLVIDRSGSMTGQKLHASKRAAAAAVTGLSRLDHVGVVAFDSAAHWQVPMQLAGNKDAIRRDIARLSSGGGTDVHAGMVEAAEALAGLGGAVKHVILLTDGQTAGPDCRPLARKMAGDRITVTTVAVGPGADRQLLHAIARTTGGRFYPVADPRNVPRIFVKEAQVVRRSLIVEDPFQPKFAGGPGEVLAGLSGVPTLDGRVLTGAKGGLNEILLAGPEGEPILATTRAGLGRVLSFTSSADSRWAAAWLAWGGYGRFWEQAVRWAARSAQPADCEMFADVQGDTVTLTVEAVRDGGGFARFAEVTAQVIDPEMDSTALPLRQVAPGQYRATFQAPAGGSYLVNLRYRPEGSGAGEASLAQTVVNVPFAPEFEDLTDNAALLGDVAETTGGRVLGDSPDTDELFSRAALAPPRAAMPLTTPLLLAWIALFLLDVGVRRIAIDFAAVARRIVGRLRLRQAGEEGGTLSALKQRRERVRQRLRAEGGRDAQARRRYEATGRPDAALPAADVQTPAADKRAPAPAEPSTPPTAKAEDTDETHVSRLLRAKRRAKMEDDET